MNTKIYGARWIINPEKKTYPMRRRVRSATLIFISQMLLIALAFAWLLQMVIIAREGSAYFIENNSLILYGEIAGSALIIIFGFYVLVTQIRRLGERRSTDRNADDQRKQETS